LHSLIGGDAHFVYTNPLSKVWLLKLMTTNYTQIADIYTCVVQFNEFLIYT
jgi:hypothetical protein